MTGDLTTIKHTASGASAQIHAVGATVISYKSANGRENLFCSRRAVKDGSKAIRGDILFCFPIFGPPEEDATMPQHDFARLNRWKLESTYDEAEAAGAKYVLDWSHVTHGMGDINPWAVDQAEKDGTRCLLTYEVRITGKEMTNTLLIENNGQASFNFQALLHTFAVDGEAAQDNAKTNVHGLGGYTIIDKVTGSKDHVQSYDDPVVITGEVDRVYLHPDEHPVVHANVHTGGASLRLEAAGQVDDNVSSLGTCSLFLSLSTNFIPPKQRIKQKTKIMPPSDFIQARETGQVRAVVDGCPYLPTVRVHAKGPLRDVAAAVVAVLQLDQRHLCNGDDDDDYRIAIDALTVEPVTGGLSNTLYRVSGLHQFVASLSSSSNNNGNKLPPATAVSADAVLVRIFGAEGMIDRDVETSTFAALSRAGLAPPYYGRFANGRLEGWMPNMRPLTTPELRNANILTQVARQMARLHVQFDIPTDLQSYHENPSMWQQLQEWLQQALQNTYQTSHDTERAKALHLETVEQEFAWLRHDVLPPQAAIVFCHNDVLAANILYNDDTQAMQLIDFEYGGCNYRSFDVANHWNEYAGGPPHVTVPRYDWLPNPEQQAQFCRTYLETAIAAAHDSNNNGNKSDKKNGHGNHHHHAVAVTDNQVETFRREVQAFLLPNHLYWGLWAINQAALEGCQEYDYMKYGMERFQQYYICKQEWLSSSSSSK